jgi:hypothetical protein
MPYVNNNIHKTELQELIIKVIHIASCPCEGPVLNECFHHQY